MELNKTFINNIQALYGDQGVVWLNTLPKKIEQLCDKWNLQFLKALPDLTYHFIGLVAILQTNEVAVLKIAPTNEQIETEANWLFSMNRTAANIYSYDSEHHAILMERLQPGHTLKALVKSGHDDNATKIICELIRNIQKYQLTIYQFKPLSTLYTNFSKLDGYFDKKMLSKAKSLFNDLTSESPSVILHGDLHHDNILLSYHTWKVIDPHGYSGDPAYEVGAMIYNPLDCFPNTHSVQQIISRRLKILSDELPFDMQRIKAWAFCKTILSIAWTFEDHQHIPSFEANVAKILDELS